MAVLKIKNNEEWIDIPSIKGNDGFSPIANVTKSGNTATITITDSTGTTTASIEGSSYDDTEIRGLIQNKVDKVTGKGLSTNDYTTEEKTKLSGLSNYNDTEIRGLINTLDNNKVDKVSGKSLSSNDYTTTEKNKLAGLNNYDDTEVRGLISGLDTNKQKKLIAGSNIVLDDNGLISAELSVPSTNTIFAMYFNNTNQSLTSTEEATETRKEITFDTTEQYIDYTYTVSTNNFVVNATTLYNLYLCLDGLSTVAGKKYTFKANWKHGNTLISESSSIAFEATASRELIGIPMPTNLLTNNLVLNTGDTLTLRIFYKTNYGDGSADILSGTGQQSAFIRNGSEVTANNVYDSFNGENRSQAYINHYLKENKASTSDVLQAVYPVGAIYISTTETNPGTLFGFGTWEQIKDTFLLSAGDTYTAGTTGGEATHTLTTNEIPAHNHSISNGTGGSGAWGVTINSSGSTGSDSYAIKNTGGGQAHNNMPPYLTVYMWKRTD